jgi:hypothetical protein
MMNRMSNTVSDNNKSERASVTDRLGPASDAKGLVDRHASALALGVGAMCGYALVCLLPHEVASWPAARAARTSGSHR